MIYNVDTFDSDIYKELSLDEKIKEYNIDSGNYVLLTKYDSLEELEDDWIKYKTMGSSDDANEKSMELTNEKNITRYRRLKHDFLEKEIKLSTEYCNPILKEEYESLEELDEDYMNIISSSIDIIREENWNSILNYGEDVDSRYNRLRNSFPIEEESTNKETTHFEPLHISPDINPTQALERRDKYSKIMAGIISRIGDPIEILDFPYREEDIKQIALSYEGTKGKNSILFTKLKNKEPNKQIKEWLSDKIWGIPIYNGKRGYIFVKDDERFYEFRIGNVPVVDRRPLKYFQMLKREKKVYNIDYVVGNRGLLLDPKPKKSINNIMEAMYEYGKNSDYFTESLTIQRMLEMVDENNVFIDLLLEDLYDKNEDYNKIPIDMNVPFFTPYEMETKGISYYGKTPLYSTSPDTTYINEKPISEWFREYKLRLEGYNNKSFINQFQWKNTIKRLCEDLDQLEGQELLDRKQSILDLGWNPEIPYNESTQKFARARISNILESMYYDIENYSNSGIDFMSTNEDSSILYITFFDKDRFGFNECVYSNSIPKEIKNEDECIIYAIRFPKDIISTVEGKSITPDRFFNTKIICENLVKRLTDKHINPIIVEVYNGLYGNILNEDSKYNLDDILPLSEEINSSIEFDDDGNLLISKGKDVDFEAEYASTHLAMQQYERTDNLEGMKYCMCKLWYMNLLLEQEIHSSDKKDKITISSYHKARSKIMNDIKTYMPIIIEKDPEFNIQTEYENSVFNNSKIKIKQSTLKYALQLFKSLLHLV